MWQAEGVSVLPILANGTKRPADRWSQYQQQIASVETVDAWWAGQDYGLALICGAVSGGLEMVEVEGRALERRDALLEIINRVDEGGAGAIWDLLTGPDGYAEDSPSGGLHLLYRISDHEVPGNTKIASRPATPQELEANLADKIKVLAETRGEGGYVIVAPTPGACHPSGKSWILVNGQYGQLPVITWEQRNLLHAALRLALHEEPPPLPVVVPFSTPTVEIRAQYEGGGISPGDDYEQRTDWSEILTPHGWHLLAQHQSGERHWVRPGKSVGDGMSATTGRAHDRDRLYVFSTSTLFEAEVPYTKFGAYALLNHGGDHTMAARRLSALGFGARRPIEDTPELGDWTPSEPATERRSFDCDEIGNAERLRERALGKYRYIWQDKAWWVWNGNAWEEDTGGALVREMISVVGGIKDEEGDPVQLAKWQKRSATRAQINSAIDICKSLDMTHSSLEWAPDRNLVNTRNGILNLRTGDLQVHDPKFLMTKTLGSTYDPEAQCPNFESFIKRAVPDDETRAYVQRALGYSLLGDADQRAIFLIYGPSGTGKSTLIETMREVFGDYGVTAGSGAFRSSKESQGPSADLHALRGSRFVTTSETSDNVSFDEDLLKRISGRDRVTSRGLYQKPVEWVPECTLWIATNNPPKFNSDDDAIWRRTKLIPFTTVFRNQEEVPDYARRYLYSEAAGILNWLLAGLRDFLANGLQEPQDVQAAAVQQRQDSDSAARFLQDKLADQVLVLEGDREIDQVALYEMYRSWASSTGERTLGSRRFMLRVASSFPQLRLEHQGKIRWVGIGRQASEFAGLATGPYHAPPIW